MDRRIRPWINKKIIEYIGEEEATLVDFVCSKVGGLDFVEFVWSKVGGSKPRRRPLWWTLCGLRLVVLNPGGGHSGGLCVV